MKSRRIGLLVGAVYAHRNGCTYRCIGREDGGRYVMQSPKGWTCIAIGIWQQEDGLIWWDYSAGGHFEKIGVSEGGTGGC